MTRINAHVIDLKAKGFGRLGWGGRTFWASVRRAASRLSDSRSLSALSPAILFNSSICGVFSSSHDPPSRRITNISWTESRALNRDRVVNLQLPTLGLIIGITSYQGRHTLVMIPSDESDHSRIGSDQIGSVKLSHAVRRIKPSSKT